MAQAFDKTAGTTRPVGIDQVGVHLPPYVLPLDALAAARGIPKEKITIGLGAEQMTVTPPWEDAVTLAANAAARVFARGEIAPEEVGMLVVGTETAVDHAKPVSIFVHELLGLASSCRTFELKHACYAGTAGVMAAADWIRSGAARGRKALVIATDIARYDVGSSAECTQGAGAVALVVAEDPHLVRLDPFSGVYATSVYDFWRPLERRCALVDGAFSLDCYLRALEGAVADYHRANAPDGAGPLTSRLSALVYHTPFPKMAYKAHARLVDAEWRRSGRNPSELVGETECSFAALVEPSLGAARRVGNAYTASLYLCLAWLAETRAPALAGQALGLFSYGSGCCAEFFTGRFAEESPVAASAIGLADLLAARRTVTVEEYEQLAGDGAVGGTPPAGHTGFFLSAVREGRRVYERTTSTPHVTWPAAGDDACAARASAVS